MKSISILIGSLPLNEKNLFRGQLPKGIIIGLVDPDSFEGVPAKKNQFNFRNFLLKNCFLPKDQFHIAALRHISADVQLYVIHFLHKTCHQAAVSRRIEYC